MAYDAKPQFRDFNYSASGKTQYKAVADLQRKLSDLSEDYYNVCVDRYELRKEMSRLRKVIDVYKALGYAEVVPK